MQRKLISLIGLILLFSTSSAYGSGFAIFTQGASALGQGNATIAHGEDPSIVFYNPALMNQLEGTQVLVGTTTLISSRRFESTSTESSTDSSKVFFPSTFYATHKLNERLSAGLGVFSPFGLGTTWNEDWEGRYISTTSDMRTFVINPVVSYRIFPGLSIAAGPDILFLDATLEKKLKIAPLPDASQKFTGNGTGLGYNIGIAYDVNPAFSLGLTYRSEIKVGIDGEATFQVPPGTPPMIAAQLANAKGKTSLTLPQQAQAGICYKGFTSWVIEVGARWEGWSSFDELKINLNDGRSMVTKRIWKDTLSYNLGGRYQVNDTVALLAGYLYGDTPVPDETFDPSIPDARTHVFSLGSAFDYKRFGITLAYAYQMLEHRHKGNTIGDPAPPGAPFPADRANGMYDSDIHLAAVSVLYRF